jgi:hypothetical protein
MIYNIVQVSGDANLDQLLVALWSLQHNKAIMLSVLNELQLWVQAHFVTAKQGLPMIDVRVFSSSFLHI